MCADGAGQQLTQHRCAGIIRKHTASTVERECSSCCHWQGASIKGALGCECVWSVLWQGRQRAGCNALPSMLWTWLLHKASCLHLSLRQRFCAPARHSMAAAGRRSQSLQWGRCQRLGEGEAMASSTACQQHRHPPSGTAQKCKDSGAGASGTARHTGGLGAANMQYRHATQ